MTRSRIHIIRTDNPGLLPAAPDRAVLLSSGGRWRGINIEHHLLPPMEMPEHFVQEHRLTINLGDPVNFEWKNKSKWIRKRYDTNDFMMLSHGEMHQPRWDTGFNFIAIALSPEYVSQLIESPHVLFCEQRGKRDYLLNLYTNKLMRELKQESFQGRIYGESIIVALAIHLACTYTQRGKVYSPKGKLSSVQLHQLIDYMQAHLGMNVGLTDLAETIHLSPFHLTRLFKQTVGIPPHRYLFEIKMARAKNLLKRPDLSIGEIGYQLGFTDHAHFSNAFKKNVGLSPRQFRSLK